jgi:hypothetical protein
LDPFHFGANRSTCLPLFSESFGPWLSPNFIRAASKAWKIEWKPKEDTPMEVQRRLLQLQHQLHKLHEKEALGLQLEKTNQSQQTLNRYGEHFKRVLLTIENHLIYGEHDHAEHVITLFSRHLRTTSS